MRVLFVFTAMNSRSLIRSSVGLAICVVVFAGLGACGPQPPVIKEKPKPQTNAASQAQRQHVVTARDPMRYDTRLFEVPAGKKVTLTFKNEGLLPREITAYNLVVLDLGRDPNAFVGEAAFAEETDYIPTEYEDWIIARTGLLASGESETIEFRAPKKPGEYPFVCSYPGHAAAGMKGIMRVVLEVPAE